MAPHTQTEKTVDVALIEKIGHMRYAMVFNSHNLARPAAVDGEQVYFFDETFADLTDVITATADERRAGLATESTRPAVLRFAAPVRPRKNVFCVGRNYLAHAEESTRAQGIKLDMPDRPTFFTKAPTSIVDPETTLQLPFELSQKFDLEVELGVIIGKRCKDISEADALDAVWGYTIVNDVTARDLQKSYGQWFKGKSLDYTCPIGPIIVDADEIPDPQQLRIGLAVNGVVKQAGSTSDMIFSVAKIIAELSSGMTLEPGDIIATGTPDGVGFARNPPEYLQRGDIMEATIETIGTLRNSIGA